MEGHMNKRRRVYSVEPRKIRQASFARKYVNYLVPALTKISKEISSSDQCIDHEIEKIVRYEVDMALALSAEGFAWSHALKNQLQLNVNNVGRFQSSLTHDQLLASFKISSSSTCSPNRAENEVDDNQNAMLLKKISSNSISNLNHECATKKSKRAKRAEMEMGTATEEGMESEEEEESKRRLTYVKNLLPGGNELMDDDEILLIELGSYISCLELQVNILRSMCCVCSVLIWFTLELQVIDIILAKCQLYDQVLDRKIMSSDKTLVIKCHPEVLPET
ncbi:transcription factor bHLH146 [Durio zibethinus]|uniref:Transcription factor bHLH146 n=1 Tax=Durio zibethinus TaxID=66656 RepID=A0A6P5ZPA2_DURZI|nr:transcription factor bHLH146 [Durio zibethinus]